MPNKTETETAAPGMELLLCPFCGLQPDSWARSAFREPEDADWIVMCVNGDCVDSLEVICKTREEAEAKWNTRPLEAALRARVAELEAAARWVPVGEKLPEPNPNRTDESLNVEAYSNSMGQIIAWYEFDAGWYSGMQHFPGYVSDVTHWRELSASPEATP